MSSNSAKSDGSIQGELGAQLDLVGSGADWDQIKQTLRGKGGLQLVEGTLKDVNLADSSLQAVKDAVLGNDHEIAIATF